MYMIVKLNFMYISNTSKIYFINIYFYYVFCESDVLSAHFYCCKVAGVHK